MFLWTLAAALGRLSGLKIVLKDTYSCFFTYVQAAYDLWSPHEGQPQSCSRTCPCTLSFESFPTLLLGFDFAGFGWAVPDPYRFVVR